jgi:hypothetical protein
LAVNFAVGLDAFADRQGMIEIKKAKTNNIE